jgi:thiol-disulfide isomerase/thioredoxin
MPVLSLRSLKLVGPLYVLACAVTVAGCDRQSDPAAQPAPSGAATVDAATTPPALSGTLDRGHKGEALPAVTVTDAAGKKLDLASLKGKPVLLNLWATWCAPCVAELPTLDTLAKIKGDKLRVITVSQDMKTDRVAAFLKDKGGANLPAWLDPNTELSFKFQVQTLPTTILFDSSGKEVWRYVGGAEWNREETAKLLLDAGVN